MKTKTFEIIINFAPKKEQDFGQLNSHDVMKRILISGYETFKLKGELIEKLSQEITFFVEDDVFFFVEDYKYLEKLVKTQKAFEHNVFLGDGLFYFSAKSKDQMVDLQLNYCPHLNLTNLITFRITTTLEKYIWWWRSIADGLFNTMGK